MRGTFSRTGEAWRKDYVTMERERTAEQAYRARVVGRRVVVTSDVDFGQVGTVVDVSESKELRVKLDAFEAPCWFARHELEAAR